MLGERINELRTIRGWNQVQLANKLDVAKQTVSNWENENIQPSVEMLVRIADLFQVSTDYLLGREAVSQIRTDDLPTEFVMHLTQIIEDYQKKR